MRVRQLPVPPCATLLIFAALACGAVGRAAAQEAQGKFVQRDRQGLLSQRLDRACPATLPTGDRQLRDLVSALHNSIWQGTAEPDDRRRQACAMARLAAQGARVTGHAAVPLGESWLEAAFDAALQAYAFEAVRAPSADVLSVLLMEGARPPLQAAPDFGANRAPDGSLDATRAVSRLLEASLQPDASETTRRGCVSAALTTGDVVTARECIHAALDVGQDSTWHLLRLAALAFWQAEPGRGARILDLAVASARDPVDREEVGWHLEPSFDADGDCIVCWGNGLLNPFGPALRPIRERYELSPAERLRWRASGSPPPGDRLAALRSVFAGEQTDRGAEPLRWPPGERFGQVVATAPATARNAMIHFYYTTYGAGTFRACRKFAPAIEPPCIPRWRAGDDEILAVQMVTRRFWETGGSPRRRAIVIAVEPPTSGRFEDLRLVVRAWGWHAGTVYHHVMAESLPAAESRRPIGRAIVLDDTGIDAIGVLAVNWKGARGGLWHDLETTSEQAGAVAAADSLVELSDPFVTTDTSSAAPGPAPGLPWPAISRTVDAGEPVRIAFQVRNPGDAVTGVRIGIEVAGLSDTWEADRPGLRVEAEFEAPPGISVHSQVIGFRNLKAGIYRLRIGLLTGGGMAGVREETLAVR